MHIQSDYRIGTSEGTLTMWVIHVRLTARKTRPSGLELYWLRYHTKWLSLYSCT